MEQFVYLHTYSAYSILHSGMSVNDYVFAIKKLGLKQAGLSDLNYFFGQPHFEKVAVEHGIRPLFGVDLMYDGLLLTLYVKNEQGYRDLIKINRLLELAAIDDKQLKSLQANIIAIITSRQTAITDNFVQSPLVVRDLFKRFALIFSSLYIGVENYAEPDQLTNFIREFALKYNYELVAFPHVKYVEASDAINLVLANAIQNEISLGETKTMSGPYHLYKVAELSLLYTESERANTVKIAEQISFKLNEKRGQLLRYPVTNGNSKSYLKQLCNEALIRLKLNEQSYQDRLDFELEVINNMGYNDYFLIVYDYVKYAKSVDILVGPGRGSAAGSLVAYLLDITTIDPLKYELLFERFLNPARQTMPDIDIDFMDIRREEIVTYLKQKYGVERISNIVTFQTNAARQSIRDIGRIYEVDSKHINLLAKSLGVSLSDLRSSYRTINSFKRLVDSDKFYLEIVALAAKIEGFPRQTGMHAAGLILNDEPLINALPIFTNNEINMSQYEMEYLEGQGFLKMDILGLTNLTTIDTCLKLIKKHRGLDLKYENIPFDDTRVYDLIASGKTMGIFQLESAGMLRAIRQIKPSNFNDIVAVLALFRPGPMENIPVYARRKQRKEQIEYLNDQFKAILDPTYGIIVYQEQIMQIVRLMAGFSYAEADMFRRAISKKDESQLAKLERDFLAGAKKTGYKDSDAKKVFDDIHKFADYGFNKSHSVAYAKLSCQMAYLKVYYPLEFYAAILDKATSSDTKFPQIAAEMKARGIRLLLPSLNDSEQSFVPSNDELRLPLSIIKGISNDKALRFIKEREQNGRFTSLENVLTRANYFDVTRNDLQLLIEAGALDEFNYSRATMLQQLDNLDLYKNYSLSEGQNFLTPIMIENIPDNNGAKIRREVDLIGLAISDNPLKYVNNVIDGATFSKIIDLDITAPRVYGYIKAFKAIKTKKGDQMGFLTLSDYEQEIEVTIFPEMYALHFNDLTLNNVLAISGQYQVREDKAQIIANKIYRLEDK